MPRNIFRIFENALAFLIKPKQLQKIENRNLKRKGENLPGSHLAQLLQPARPTWPVPVISHLCQKAEACRPRAHRRPPPPCLAAPSSLWTSLAMPRSPLVPLAHSLELIPLLCSLSHPRRAQPSPPTSTAMATATAPPRRCAQRLRLDPLFLSTEPRPAGSPAASSPTSSSTSGRRRTLRGFASSSLSPASPLPLLDSP
jgi:hypothetical protein